MSSTPAPLLDEAAQAAVEQLRAGVAALQELELSRLGDGDLLGLLRVLDVETNRVQAAGLATLVEADGRGSATTAGAVSTASWWGWAARVHPGKARADLRLGHALARD